MARARAAQSVDCAEPEAEQPEVEQQHRAAEDAKREQVHRLDDREEPQRLPDGVADPRRFAPFEKREEFQRDLVLSLPTVTATLTRSPRRQGASRPPS